MSRRRIAVPIVVLLVLAAASVPATGAPAPPVASAAATCSDYSNQAAAQRAADTRDSDHDGIYCESLPCPCAKPGSAATPKPTDTPLRTAPTGLGRSVTLRPVRRRSGCRVRGSLPDPRCTTGARFSRATATQVCRSRYSSGVRHVTSSTKSAIYAEYGMRRHFDGRTGEVDHLVSLELGGSNSRANLWPEAAGARYGSIQKDRLENALHGEVCSGRITLRAAQRAIAGDWVAAYRARLG